MIHRAPFRLSHRSFFPLRWSFSHSRLPGRPSVMRVVLWASILSFSPCFFCKNTSDRNSHFFGYEVEKQMKYNQACFLKIKFPFLVHIFNKILKILESKPLVLMVPDRQVSMMCQKLANKTMTDPCRFPTLGQICPTKISVDQIEEKRL